MNTVHVVVPAGIDDPARPSGGNVFDRRLIDGLAAAGWDVRVQVVVGSWPHPDRDALAALTTIVAAVADDAVVLVDGLIASVAPAVLGPHADRLRLIVIVHMPLGDGPTGSLGARAAEGAVLSAAGAVVTTSRWTRGRLLEMYPLPPERIFVAPPGVDPAPLAPGSDDGGALLCVAAVAAPKGHDVLLAALAEVRDRRWQCCCVGALDLDLDYVARLARQCKSSEISDRVSFVGAQVGGELDCLYADADALVVASRFETYGMVITEALARGIPVIASSVGGVPEAMRATRDGRRPGLLVAPGDPRALSRALRSWLTDAELRQSLRAAARAVRPTLPGWDATTKAVLTSIFAQPSRRSEPRTSSTRIPV